MRVVGCVRIKNGERYVARWIEDMSKFCDFLCMLDDGSTDGTVAIIEREARLRGNIFFHKHKGLPRDEGRDCNILFDMASTMKADWIFAPDVDEFVDPQDFDDVRQLLQTDRPDVLAWTFPFFYLWDDERHYRFDGWYSTCHVIRLFRYRADLRPPRRPMHSQMCPDELDRRLVRVAPARMVHYGYMDRHERVAKHHMYTELSKGTEESYDHIIADKGLEIRDYPTRKEWRSEIGGKFGAIDRMALRLHVGPDPLPGFISADYMDYESMVGNVDEIFLSDMHSMPRGLDELARLLKPGGRIDITTMDFERWVADFSAASSSSDEQGKDELLARLGNRSPYWENRLMRAMLSSKLHRTERIPLPGLHMMAFKQNEQEN